MLEFGWSEMLLIVVLAVFLLGPEDIPKVMVAVGRVFRRLHYIKYALSQQFEDIMRDADLDDLRQSVNFESKRREAAIKAGDFNEAEADEAEYLLSKAQSEPEGLNNPQAPPPTEEKKEAAG